MTTAAPEASMMYAPGRMETPPTQRTEQTTTRETQNDRDYDRSQDLWRREKAWGDKLQQLREELNTARQQQRDVRNIENQIRHAEREQVRLRQRAERLTFGSTRFGDQFLTDWHRFWNRGEGNRPNLLAAVADEVGGVGERRREQAVLDAQNQPEGQQNERRFTPLESARNILNGIRTRIRRNGDGQPTTRENPREALQAQIAALEAEETDIIRGHGYRPDENRDKMPVEMWNDYDRYQAIQTELATLRARAERMENGGGGLRELPPKIQAMVDELIKAFREKGAPGFQAAWENLQERIKSDPDFRDYAVFLGIKLALRAAFGPLGLIGGGAATGALKLLADSRATDRANDKETHEEAVQALTDRFQQRIAPRTGLQFGEVIVPDEVPDSELSDWQRRRRNLRRILEKGGKFIGDVLMSAEASGDLIALAPNRKMKEARDIMGRMEMGTITFEGDQATQPEAWVASRLEKCTTPQQLNNELSQLSLLLRDLNDLAFFEYQEPITGGQYAKNVVGNRLDKMGNPFGLKITPEEKPTPEQLKNLHEFLNKALFDHRQLIHAKIALTENQKTKRDLMQLQGNLNEMVDPASMPIFQQERILMMNRRVDRVHGVMPFLKGMYLWSLGEMASGHVQLGGGNETIQPLRNPLAEQGIPESHRIPTEWRTNLTQLTEVPDRIRGPVNQLIGHLQQQGLNVDESQRNFLANMYYSASENNQANYLKEAAAVAGKGMNKDVIEGALYRIVNSSLYGDSAFGDNTMAKDVKLVKDVLAQLK